MIDLTFAEFTFLRFKVIKMKYQVVYNRYDKQLNIYHDIKKVFDNMADAIEFISKLKKLKQWESVSVTAEK